MKTEQYDYVIGIIIIIILIPDTDYGLSKVQMMMTERSCDEECVGTS